MEHKIYLSKRNLLTLLSKLERLEQGQDTKCAIVKYANPLDPFCNTINEVMVIAVPDDKFYAARQAGEMHPLDEERIKNA